MRQTTMLLLTLALAGAACRKGTLPDRVSGRDLDEIIASMPDSAMRQRWRAASANGQLPPLDSLRIPRQPVTMRATPRIDSTSYRFPPPSIPAGAVAEVRFESPTPLSAYNGPFTLLTAAPGKIVGRLTEKPEPVEIYFKLAATSQALPVRDSALTLTLQQDIVGGSFRRTLLLAGTRGGVMLFDLSDGDLRRPYARDFKELPLSIRQGAPGSESPLTVVYAGQRLLMTPGRVQRARDRNGEVEIYLLENYTTAPSAIRGSEADAFHVRLLIWRVG